MVPDSTLPQSFRVVARRTTILHHRVGATGDVTDLGENEILALELDVQQRGPIIECSMNMSVFWHISGKNAQAFTANTNHTFFRSFDVLHKIIKINSSE